MSSILTILSRLVNENSLTCVRFSFFLAKFDWNFIQEPVVLDQVIVNGKEIELVESAKLIGMRT